MAARPMILFAPLPLITLAITLAACGLAKPQAAADTQEVTINGKAFQLELALDNDARYRGLSDRPSIAEDGGMLFVFPNAAVRSFVMRRCLVPIDIIFVSPSGRVVATHEMQLEPYDTPDGELKTYSSQWPAQFAIELKDGSIEGLGIEEGQKIDLPLEDLKGRAR